jgi:hypothetical protein
MHASVSFQSVESTTAPSYKEPDSANLDADSIRLARSHSDELLHYLHEGESITGFGYGGSESLTLFIKNQAGEQIVRKILSEPLITPRWDPAGRDVMLPPHLKAHQQARWLQGLPEEVRPLFPAVLGLSTRPARVASAKSNEREFVYDMSYVPGLELSRFVRDHQPSPAVVALIYSELHAMLRERVHRLRQRVPQGPTLEASYFRKIEKRLALSQATAPQTFSERLLDSRSIYINGRIYHNVGELLRIFRRSTSFQSVLEPRFHSLVVGDTNTENVKIGNIAPLLAAGSTIDFNDPPFTAADLDIRFLDPRAIGFHERGVDTGSDDPLYDNKPWHNSIGNYDMIHGEHFQLGMEYVGGIPAVGIDFDAGNPYWSSYQGIEQYFRPAMTRAWDLNNPESDVWRNDPYWLIRFVFMMGTHFMAMPPFHFSRDAQGTLHDSPRAQKRPLAIYCEGIKWLNLALDMLHGGVDEFLGFPVPDIGLPLRYPVNSILTRTGHVFAVA